jgi:hypothetical protein
MTEQQEIERENGKALVGSEPDPVAWRPKAWRRQVGGMSNSKLYGEIGAGRIETVKMGSATLIVTPPRQYIENLKSQAA